MINFDSDDNFVVHGDNMDVLPKLPDETFQLIYIDPPFNTGGQQQRKTLRTVRTTEAGDRTGFGGRRYSTTETGRMGYLDAYDDYLGVHCAPLGRGPSTAVGKRHTLFSHRLAGGALLQGSP